MSLCTDCQTQNKPGATRCTWCGTPLAAGKIRTPQQSGRYTEELSSKDGRFYDALPPDAGWLARIAQQERIVELALEDLDDASQQWRGTRSDVELGQFRELNPADRHRWVQRMQAEDWHAAALSNYERQKARLDRMLDEFEKAAGPVAPSWWKGSYDETFGRL